MELAKFGQNGDYMGSLVVVVCVLCRNNKKTIRGAKMGMEGGEAIKKTNICLHFVQFAQTYKIVSKSVDFFN